MRQDRLTLAGLGVGMLALATAVPLFASPFHTSLATQMLFFALFAMSLDLLVGYTHLPSLGHAAYYGVGAYAVAIMSVHAGVDSFPVNLLVGVAAATAVAAVYGLLQAHTWHMTFFVITLALAQVLWGLAFRWFEVTGGENGLVGIAQPAIAGWEVDSIDELYYMTLGFAAVAAVLIFLITVSPFGRSLVGIRESPTRMAALGYNVWLHKYVVIVIAGLFGGLAGVLSAYYNQFVGPNYLNVTTSVTVMLMVILGGAGTLVGPMIGAALIVWLEVFVSGLTERWVMIMGGLYILAMVVARRGIVGEIRHRLAVRPGRVAAAAPAPTEAELVDPIGAAGVPGASGEVRR